MENNELDPPPHEINLEENKLIWIIDGIRICARNYTEALEIYSLIKQ